jgi:putative membrane protein
VPGFLNNAAGRAAIALALTVAGAGLLMLVLGSDAYDWIKAIHVIAIIAWMAAMLYLPRLFIYHCGSEPSSKQSETFKVMEARLTRIIMNPSMAIAWVLGLWLAFQAGWFAAPWFHAKLLAAFAMSAVHGYFVLAVRKFAEDRNDKSARYWRLMNEVPTVLMIAIVILVIVKPF